MCARRHYARGIRTTSALVCMAKNALSPHAKQRVSWWPVEKAHQPSPRLVAGGNRVVVLPHTFDFWQGPFRAATIAHGLRASQPRAAWRWREPPSLKTLSKSFDDPTICKSLDPASIEINRIARISPGEATICHCQKSSKKLSHNRPAGSAQF